MCAIATASALSYKATLSACIDITHAHRVQSGYCNRLCLSVCLLARKVKNEEAMVAILAQK